MIKWSWRDINYRWRSNVVWMCCPQAHVWELWTRSEGTERWWSVLEVRSHWERWEMVAFVPRVGACHCESRLWSSKDVICVLSLAYTHPLNLQVSTMWGGSMRPFHAASPLETSRQLLELWGKLSPFISHGILGIIIATENRQRHVPKTLLHTCSREYATRLSWVKSTTGHSFF